MKSESVGDIQVPLCWSPVCKTLPHISWSELVDLNQSSFTYPCLGRHPTVPGVSICLQHCEGPKSLPSLPVPYPPLPLEVGTLNPARGSGECRKSSFSGVWGKAAAANEIGAFSGWRNAAGGIQDARFETSKNGLSLRFYEEVFQELISSI